ncbi:MAG TPA: protocatechuate 3,4-dioxygenase subunit alpha, partial [Solirubrobacterales bacterium]|nr:protocatechuate 3,4-dioxygenase subunit alpha [Solirubrobacterales bacterium]
MSGITPEGGLAPTPSQTVGPFFGFALPWPHGNEAVAPDTPGPFQIYGRVTDGGGDGIPDAMIETWQADPDGRFNHPDDPRGAVAPPDGFRGFARSSSDVQGNWSVWTVKPGAIPGQDGTQAPHIAVTILSRGLLQRLVTRIYFPEDADAFASDPVLSGL